MTGVPLGLRSTSFNSLQQLQLQNGGVFTALPAASLPRRPSKALLYLPREKERVCPSICRQLGRGKVAMLLLVGLGFLVFVFGCFMIYSGGNISSEIEDTRSYTVTRHQHKLKPPRAPGPPSLSKLKATKGYFPTLSHQCDHFALPPPPPADRRRPGPRPCPVCYIPVEQAIASMPSSPSVSPVLHSLTYVQDENPIQAFMQKNDDPTTSQPDGGSDFGGYPTLQERDAAFDIKEDMTVYCGFVKGSRPGRHTGFDFDEADLFELDQYHDVIVASAIFGNYDLIQQPRNISKAAKKNVPFYMFIDDETESFMKNASILDGTRRVGLWRIIVVRNIPYTDARRNGKVPKLLLHRIFPNVRYSIWIDGKLQLVVDPYQVLERFLWRPNATFAISRHYRRFDVFVEAEANKAAGKYENASIDRQVQFYQYHDGLTHYSKEKLPITSDVPEGCVIIREHIPITNLFTCLWFNEVDRFTSRDQISFSTVRDKIMAKADWSVNMFLDCERRNFVIQGYHRDILEHMPPPIVRRYPPAVARNSNSYNNNNNNNNIRPQIKKNPRRGRDRKSGSRRHHKLVGNILSL
ncbi:hypothetical protein PIB30_045367 [Stylosanthes scabra]|uniref:TOD1/MUCI70 glycosyltransferase-like domain-containing protein n=1 Tax=Stylosanthes scabra TaxID=79078 RepID=A0ABU6SGT2_9FABA|nr:hypothetical protein [Stylosanthes scabra]